MIYTFWLPRSSSASKPGNVSAPACGQQPVCLALDLARPFPLRQVFAPVGRGSHGRTKKTLSTEVTGQVFVCIVPDYFTNAAKFLFSADKTALAVARVFHDFWLMRYGCPSWLTSDNGTEFQGAFRHQLERFGVEHIHTSSHHPQSNGAAERVVQTLKSMLAAKVAGAMHDWRSMLPTLRMEYMQRRHSTTGYSPNELVFATEVRLPPPVGELHWVARTAAISPDVVPSGPLTQTPESVSIYRLISMYNGSDSNTSAHTRFAKPLETRRTSHYPETYSIIHYLSPTWSAKPWNLSLTVSSRGNAPPTSS